MWALYQSIILTILQFAQVKLQLVHVSLQYEQVNLQT